MFCGLARILFPTPTCKASKQSPFNPLNVYIGSTRDTEFCLSFALGIEIDMASLTLFMSML